LPSVLDNSGKISVTSIGNIKLTSVRKHYRIFLYFYTNSRIFDWAQTQLVRTLRTNFVFLAKTPRIEAAIYFALVTKYALVSAHNKTNQRFEKCGGNPMKQIIFALFAMLAGMNMAFANNCSLLDENCGDEDDYEYRVCTASDASGNTYKYYTPTWWDASYTKKQAVAKCKANSSSPKSCKAVSCLEY